MWKLQISHDIFGHHLEIAFKGQRLFSQPLFLKDKSSIQ